MTSVEWMEAARLAMEILKQQREMSLTKHQAERLLQSFGFEGLLAGVREPERSMSPAEEKS